MKNFKEIKTTILGLLLWVVDAFYFGLPYFSDKDLWEANTVYEVALFVSGLGLLLAPDNFIQLFFGWLKKKTQ